MSARLSINLGWGASRLPADIALSLIPSLPRRQLERLVQRLIDGLDDMDPNPDLEPGDIDHSGSEDDFWRPMQDGPGCPIADSDMAVDDEGEDDQAGPPVWETRQ